MKKVLFILTVVQNTLIGRSKQSIGNATFTTWKGKNVLKSKPLTVENPRTDAQVTQRLRMSAVVIAYRFASAIINLGFKERAVGMSEYNAFASQNIMSATSVTLPSTFAIIYANLKLAMGTIFPQPMSSISPNAAADNVTLSWATSPLQPGQSASDKINIAIYNETQFTWSVFTEDALRSAGTVTKSVSALTTGDVLHVYTFFTKADASKSSDSVYDTVTA